MPLKLFAYCSIIPYVMALKITQTLTISFYNIVPLAVQLFER